MNRGKRRRKWRRSYVCLAQFIYLSGFRRGNCLTYAAAAVYICLCVLAGSDRCVRVPAATVGGLIGPLIASDNAGQPVTLPGAGIQECVLNVESHRNTCMSDVFTGRRKHCFCCALCLSQRNVCFACVGVSSQWPNYNVTNTPESSRLPRVV